MITGLERLAAAINGEKSDRIPVFCNLIDQGAKELGLPIKEYFSDGAHVAEAQIRMREKYGFDNVWSLFYVGREAELFGCDNVIYATDGPPNVGSFIIKNFREIENLPVPDNLTSHPVFEEQKKCLDMLKKEVGGRYPICAYITSSMSLPAMLMGMERWMELLFLGPADLRELLLEKCFTFFVREVEAYRQLGADVLVYSNPFGSTDTVPLTYFTDHSLPLIIKEIEAVGAQGMVYYCGMSRFNQVIDIIIEKTDFRAFYISPLDDLAGAKAIVAGRGLTCGVVNDIKLLEWSQDQIRSHVRQLIQDGMPGGRFLLGTGVMPYNIPETSIRSMLEAAYEFGQFD